MDAAVPFTASESVLQPMASCPKGRLVLLLTRYGVLTKGVYDGSDSYLAWAPLPKIPEWLREQFRYGV